jgi:hypothetical protein
MDVSRLPARVAGCDQGGEGFQASGRQNLSKRHRLTEIALQVIRQPHGGDRVKA